MFIVLEPKNFKFFNDDTKKAYINTDDIVALFITTVYKNPHLHINLKGSIPITLEFETMEEIDEFIKNELKIEGRF